MIKVIRVCLYHYTQAVFLGRNKKKKVSETSITGNKVTQDPDDTNKEAKVGCSIEGIKQTSVCVTPHPSGLTPSPYKNKQDYKGGTNDKTHDSYTHESGVSRSYDASLARNLYAEIIIQKMMNILTIRQ